MDPNTTYSELREHLRLNEATEAIEKCRALIEWLNKGGFTPTDAPESVEASSDLLEPIPARRCLWLAYLEGMQAAMFARPSCPICN